MTQEDKDLSLKDLCARLPYGVKCYVPVENCTMELTGKRLNYFCFHKDVWGIDYTHEQEIVLDPLNDVSNNYIVKPYLRPMSSMTEEEFESLKEYSGLKYGQLDLASYQNGTYKCLDFYLSEVPSYVVILVFDWLNAHHFDYRGLIEKDLAIAVTEENNPYKE